MTQPARPWPWRRRSQPVLSALTTTEPWCRVQLYNPSVVRVGDTYRMWYLGDSTETRTPDLLMGLAESDDAVHWRPHPHNPILTGDDLPEPMRGGAWQTPNVHYDPDAGRYRMWCVMSTGRKTDDNKMVDIDQRLGYAESDDGIQWRVHPEPLLRNVRGPCVRRDGSAGYVMWANAAPDPDDPFKALVGNIYRFTSADGLDWRRDDQPCLQPAGEQMTVVYPHVSHDGERHHMWYGAHMDGGGVFEIFQADSDDGIHWRHNRETPALPATRDANDFDGRFTSTPCVIDDGDRWLMYYSARDWGNLYGAGDGTIKHDNVGIYRHIGLATCDNPATA